MDALAPAASLRAKELPSSPGEVHRHRVVVGVSLALAGIGGLATTLAPHLAPAHLVTVGLGALALGLARWGRLSLAGVAATAAALVQPWHGLLTPEATTTVVWEIGWLTLAIGVAAATLRPPTLLPVLAAIVIGELALMAWNPGIGASALRSMAVLVALLAGLALAYARERSRLLMRVAEREAALREATARERARAAELEDARDALLAAQAERLRASRLAALGELSSAVAHEINNPLAAATWSVEELEEVVGDDAEELVALREALERCEAVVARLLALAEVDEGPGPVDAEALIAGVLSVLEPHLEAQGVRVEMDIPRSLQLHGREAELRELLFHLLLNAGDAAGARVRIVGRVDAESFVLGVEDDGPGVDPALGGEVFRPFVSGGSRGPGLGLARCHGIAQRHGGTIAHEAAGERGTRFVVRLPAA
ncbi:MAG: HAMP domain-containing sensor histidine kinase [Myxococcota bacterium]